MSLHAEWTDEELPELQAFINRALNTADPAHTPKWAWKLDAAVTAKINDINRARQKKILLDAVQIEPHSGACLSVAGGTNDDDCICGADFRNQEKRAAIESQFTMKEFKSDK